MTEEVSMPMPGWGLFHFLEAQIVRLDDVVTEVPALHAVRRRPNRVAERYEDGNPALDGEFGYRHLRPF